MLVASLSFDAVGRDGIRRTFTAEVEHEIGYRGETWTYRVPEADGPNFFEARFVAVASLEIQPDMLNHNGVEEFSAKGIPEALFAAVVAASARTLVSSSNVPAHQRLPNERREDSATKVWRRLVDAGRASYDADRDRFTYVPS